MTPLIYLILCLAYCLVREWQISKERRELLNRIQAPEIAVAQSMPLSEPIIMTDEMEANIEAHQRGGDD